MDTGKRADLRDKVIFTIDGADAKDLDDAVSIEKNESGNYILGVHIADVSYYVPEGGLIDIEALKRGTSIYPAGQVIHMLPEELATGICSLDKGEDRLTLSIDMEITPDGEIVSHEIYESLISSCERMVYADVSDIIENKNLKLTEKYGNIYREIKMMDELAAVLRKRRAARGSLDFDLDEAFIRFGADGKAESIEIYERGPADRIIEEFMIVANETVAGRFFKTGAPFVYRVHNKPEQEKMEGFKEFIKHFGLTMTGSMRNVNARALTDVLKQAEGKEFENVVSKVMLRAMSKAFYSPACTGHFGLGLAQYCHFTAPIRRYPDLMVHRLIKEYLKGPVDIKRRRALRKKTKKVAEISSVAERKALEFEREAEKIKKAEYMSRHIGETFEGVVSGVMYYGVFVELPNTIEGLARTYSKDKVYSIGEKIKVELISADIEKGYIDFNINGH